MLIFTFAEWDQIAVAYSMQWCHHSAIYYYDIMMWLCMKLTQGHTENRGRQLEISDHCSPTTSNIHPKTGCWLIPPHCKDLQMICMLGSGSPPSLLGPGLISALCSPGANSQSRKDGSVRQWKENICFSSGNRSQSLWSVDKDHGPSSPVRLAVFEC